MRIHLLISVAACALAGPAFAQAPAHTENFQRGQELFENQCRVCHGDLKPSEGSGRINTVDDLRKRIVGWAAHTGTDWKDSEVDDVLYFMNQSFYHLKSGEF
jgi:mono/diheme cytochrome c family protein